jgi:hypothetical protein
VTRPPPGELRHPSWALLSCLGCIVLTAVGGVLWNVLPCISLLGLGALCRAGALPAAVQVALVGLLFAVGWVVAYAFGHGRWQARLQTLWDVEALLPAAAMFGGFGLVLGIGSLLLGHAPAVVAAVALLPAVVAAWMFLYRPPPQPAPPGEQP